MAFHSLGGWDPEAVTLIKRIAKQSARKEGRDEDQMDRFTFQRISIALMQGNGLILSGCKLGNLPSEIDGYL